MQPEIHSPAVAAAARPAEQSGMRLRAMRWADHWLGVPLCFFCGLGAMLARAMGDGEAAPAVSGKRPIAIFKFFGLGSIMEATPLLRAIRQRHPHAPLVFVTFDSMADLVRRLGLCTDILVLRTSSPLLFAWDCLRALGWLRSHHAEAVVDLEFFSRFSTLLAFASGAPMRVGYHLNDFWRRSIVTHPIYYNCFRHVTEVFSEAGRQLDVTLTDHRISRLDVSPRSAAAAAESLRPCGWREGRPLLGVNVNSGELCHERRWPMDRFAAVVTQILRERPDLRIAVTGSPSEEEYSAQLIEQLPADLRGRTFLAAGAWPLETFIAGLGLMDGFLTNDSGPMHLAAAQGCAIVSLWGPARPAFIAPKAERLKALYSNYRCSPCVNMFTSFEGMWCGHQGWCMREIQADEVVEAVRKMLDESRSAASSSARAGHGDHELHEADESQRPRQVEEEETST